MKLMKRINNILKKIEKKIMIRSIKNAPILNFDLPKLRGNLYNMEFVNEPPYTLMSPIKRIRRE